MTSSFKESRKKFFDRINEKQAELNSVDKLTAENQVSWTTTIIDYLTQNQLNDFLAPKTEFLSNHHAFRQERLLGDLILSTISNSFKETYLVDFRFRLVSELWAELQRCFQYPVSELKPILNELKSIKRKDCADLKDYCTKFSLLLNQIPNELLNKNLHNLFSIFYGSSVHLSCKRLAENNRKLILPKYKLNRSAQSMVQNSSSQCRFNNGPPPQAHRTVPDHFTRRNELSSRNSSFAQDRRTQLFSNEATTSQRQYFSQPNYPTIGHSSSFGYNQFNQFDGNQFNQFSGNQFNRFSGNQFNNQPNSNQFKTKTKNYNSAPSLPPSFTTVLPGFVAQDRLANNLSYKLNLTGSNSVQCRYCKKGHSTSNCTKLKNKLQGTR